MRLQFWIAPLLLVLGVQAHAYDPQDYVIARPGSLPVILTVPHDGGDFMFGVPTRSKGVMGRDERTRELAEQTADIIEKKTGKRPFLVVAKFSRKQIDANRSEQEAVDSPEGLAAYRAFHAHVAAFIATVQEKFPGGGVLIDVHGQSDESGTIFLGTRNGLSVKALAAKHGAPAITGDGSILGSLRASGYLVFPAEPGIKEDSRFNGGNTVVAYGSHKAKGIDTMQLEFGRATRNSSRLPEDFASAILAFHQKYLDNQSSRVAP